MRAQLPALAPRVEQTLLKPKSTGTDVLSEGKNFGVEPAFSGALRQEMFQMRKAGREQCVRPAAGGDFYAHPENNATQPIISTETDRNR